MSQLGLDLTEDVITKVINAQPWAIERVLIILRDKITDYLSDQRDNPHPEADQNRGSFFYSLQIKISWIFDKRDNGKPSRTLFCGEQNP